MCDISRLEALKLAQTPLSLQKNIYLCVWTHERYSFPSASYVYMDWMDTCLFCFYEMTVLRSAIISVFGLNKEKLKFQTSCLE